MSKKSKKGSVRCQECGIQCKLKNLKSCKNPTCELMQLRDQMYPEKNVPLVGQATIDVKALSFTNVRKYFQNKPVKLVSIEEVPQAESRPVENTDIPWQGY